MKVFLLLLVSCLLQLTVADLPIHCLHAQISGDWLFTLDAGGRRPNPNGDASSVSCGFPQPDRNADHFIRTPTLVPAKTIKVSLTEPNVATDDKGNKGTWTMIYDEGFEVDVGGLRFFAFNRYAPNPGTPLSSDKVAGYTSYCDSTMVGWYSNGVNNFGCWQGNQTKALHPWTSRVSRVADDGVNAAPVVSPNALIESFKTVLVRDSQKQEYPVVEDGVSFLEQDSSFGFPHVSTQFPELDESVLFEPDYTFIERHNRNKANTWRATSHRQFHKKPVREMMRMLGMRNFHKNSLNGPNALNLPQPIKDDRPDSIKYAGLPSQWDWSNRNGVSYDTEIRNQGSCGSCYAMASISALEARFRVKSRNALRPILSPQEVVSCSFYNQGCEGGYPFLVAKHGTEFGMVNAECVPYTARNSECQPLCAQPRLKIHNYSYVGGFFGGCNEAIMMREIYENGPVMVAFQAPPDLFYYSGGVYTGPAPKAEPQGVAGVNVWQQTNHAVVAVGWGVDTKTGVKFWKLKNTWGARWGEKGYFRIRRGTNECGVESMATKADVLLPAGLQIPADAPNPWQPAKAYTPRFRQRRQRRHIRKVNLDYDYDME